MSSHAAVRSHADDDDDDDDGDDDDDDEYDDEDDEIAPDAKVLFSSVLWSPL